MRLVGEATADGYVTERKIACQHESLGLVQAPANNVGVCRLTKGALEGPAEIGRTEFRHLAQFVEPDRLVQPGIDENNQPVTMETLAKKP